MFTSKRKYIQEKQKSDAYEYLLSAADKAIGQLVDRVERLESQLESAIILTEREEKLLRLFSNNSSITESNLAAVRFASSIQKRKING